MVLLGRAAPRRTGRSRSRGRAGPPSGAATAAGRVAAARLRRARGRCAPSSPGWSRDAGGRDGRRPALVRRGARRLGRRPRRRPGRDGGRGRRRLCAWRSATRPSSSRELPSRFVVATADPDALCARADAAGVAACGPRPGRRRPLPAGRRWSTSRVERCCARPTRGTWRRPWATRDASRPVREWGARVKEACGVFGVYAPGTRVANLTFDGLFALQHRGQESAGMAVSDGDTVTVVKDMGLVATVFDERTLSGLRGSPRHRPHPLLDPRRLGLGRRPARLPAGRAGRVRARPQRQPDQHRRAGREGRHAARLRSPPTATWWPSCWPTPFPETEDLSTALQAVLPILEGAFSFVLDELRAALRGARPVRLPAAVPRPHRARPTRPRAGCWPPSRRRSASSAPPSCARWRRASWS